MDSWHGQLRMGGAGVRFKLLGEILFIEVWDCFTIITGITHDNNNTRQSISVSGVNKPLAVWGQSLRATESLAWGKLRLRLGMRNISGGGWHLGRWSPDNGIVMRTHDSQHSSSSQNMEYLALGVISLFKYNLYTETDLIRPVFMAVDILKYYTEAIFIILPPNCC